MGPLHGATAVCSAYIVCMCGRYTLTSPEAVIQALFGDAVRDGSGLRPRYNIAPTQEVPVVRQNHGLELFSCRWGLVPAWANPEKPLPTLINARCETVHEKPSFRSAFRARRCVVLADGFYEWERKGDQKLPWYFRRQGGLGFGMAAIWESWEKGGSLLESVSIITTKANALVGRIHDRMPVMLAGEALEVWLALGPRSLADLKAVMAPFPEAQMCAQRVGVAVNKATAEGEGLVAGVG